MIKTLQQRLFWLTLALSTVLFLYPISGISSQETHIDKIIHALIFFLLTLLAQRAYRSLTFARTCIALMGYGLLIELVQWRTPYRSFELYDLLADGIGVLLAALLGSIQPRHTSP